MACFPSNLLGTVKKNFCAQNNYAGETQHENMKSVRDAPTAAWVLYERSIFGEKRARKTWRMILSWRQKFASKRKSKTSPKS
jgi:hypothetical protein